MKPLSHTSIGLYLSCPQGFKLHYLDRHPTKPAAPLNKGSAVHAALEFMYRGRLSTPPPLEHVLDAFDEAFDEEAYLTHDEREDAYADGTRMVQEFYQKHAEDFRPAMAVEQRIQFEVDGTPLTGYIDRIDKLDDGRVRIVDYKTGKLMTRREVETAPQLSLYQLGVEELLGLEVESVEYYHVPSQTPIRTPRHPEEQVEAARERVREVARGIEAGAFEPVKQARCSWCDWREWCSLYADWYPENWPQEPTAPAPSHEEAKALADRFGEAKARAEEADKEAREAREALERFFEATGERAVSGERFRVTGSRTTGLRFDHEALREVLEPAGLWGRVLKPDYRAEERLLEDPDVPEEVKARVRGLAEARVGWRVTSTPHG